MESEKQQIAINQTKIDEEKKRYKQMNTPVDVTTFTDTMPGGRDGEIAKYLTDKARKLGYITDIADGISTVTPQNGRALLEDVQKNPYEAQKLSLMHINETNKGVSMAMEALTKKPNDPALKANLDNARMQHNAAVGANAGLMDYLKSQPKPGSLTDIQKEEFKQNAAEKAFERQKELKTIPQAIVQQTPKLEQYINKTNDPNLDEKTKNIYADMIEKETGKKDPKNKIELTKAALSGDVEAQNILSEIAKADINLAKEKGVAQAEGKIIGLQNSMDLSGTAQAVLEGRETIENVKNTFGVPIQETVRKMVLEKEPLKYMEKFL